MIFDKKDKKFKGTTEEVIERIRVKIAVLSDKLEDAEKKAQQGVYSFTDDSFVNLGKEISALYYDKHVNSAEVPDEIRRTIFNNLLNRYDTFENRSYEEKSLNLMRLRLSRLSDERAIRKEGEEVLISAFNESYESCVGHILSEAGKRELASMKKRVERIAGNSQVEVCE